MGLDAGITIVVGVPGSGKSLMAAELIAYTPGRIVGNVRITPAHPAWRRYEYIPSHLILQVTEGSKREEPTVKGFWDYPALQGRTKARPRDPGYTIFIDEAAVYFDCEEHKALRKPLFRFLKQHRKRQIRMVFFEQSVENIWVRIRRLAQCVILCHKDSSGRIGWMPKFLRRFVRVSYASAKMTKPIATAFLLESSAKEMFGWYDTSELI